MNKNPKDFFKDFNVQLNLNSFAFGEKTVKVNVKVKVPLRSLVAPCVASLGKTTVSFRRPTEGGISYGGTMDEIPRRSFLTSLGMI